MSAIYLVMLAAALLGTPAPLLWPELPTADGISLTDLERFPTREVVHQARQLNRRYHAYLVNASAFEVRDRDQLLLTIVEANRLYGIWDALDDASCMQGANRHRELARLRTLIGEADYLAGRMPYWLPVAHADD